MITRSWGNFPKLKSYFLKPEAVNKVQEAITSCTSLITAGNHRSYGDSALAPTILISKKLDKFLAFNAEEGTLTCQSGVLLKDILAFIVPKGWFLPVVPGTQLITVGGAIASDVHGKNHHQQGCFSTVVQRFSLMLASGEIVECKKGDVLFHATCSGMGLTGVILDATLILKKIASAKVEQTTFKVANLHEMFDVFEAQKDKTYSVAWIDCFAKGKDLGRGLVMIGEFANDNMLSYTPKKNRTLPFYFPTWVLNKFSIKVFNTFYYNSKKNGVDLINFESFFFPLDSLKQWNKMYGKEGFIQYQFILPLKKSKTGLVKILEKIAQSGEGSFLAVLKLYGEQNKNYLSFPMKGYSLALDFAVSDKVFALLDELDEILVSLGGRVYLAKDACIKQHHFEMGYPQVAKFREVRAAIGAKTKFNSYQSIRLGL